MGEKKPNLVAWDMVCLPVELGGLGLKCYKSFSCVNSFKSFSCVNSL